MQFWIFYSDIFFLANIPYFNFQINFQSSHLTKKETEDASKRLSSYCMGALNCVPILQLLNAVFIQWLKVCSLTALCGRLIEIKSSFCISRKSRAFLTYANKAEVTQIFLFSKKGKRRTGCLRLTPVALILSHFWCILKNRNIMINLKYKKDVYIIRRVQQTMF